MKHIAILTGGLGSERPIALASAENVAKALAPHYKISLFTLPEELPKFIAEHKLFDAAVPIMHGKGGEDGSIQGLLTWLNLPYIFSDIHGHAVALNKQTAKELAKSRGVKTANYRLITHGETITYEHPVVIKPTDSGSSVGVSLVRSSEELVGALTKGFAESKTILVEDYIQGDEFSVAVMEENNQPIALPVIAITTKNAFFDYDAKYTNGLAEELCPAPIDDALALRLQEVAIKAHQAIGARHVSRTDMILDASGQLWFLEINTIPGMSVLLPKAIAASGRNFGEVLARWIENALA